MADNLTFKINNKKLEITLVKKILEESPVVVRAPGSGKIEIPSPEIELEESSEGMVLKCRAKVSGKNIAYLYSEVMLQIGGRLIGPILQDYLRSSNEHEVKGLLRPKWGSENLLEYVFKPEIALLYCGELFTLASLQPDRYGVAPEEQIWGVEGVYQRGGGEPFRARLDFDAQGTLVKKIGFYPAIHEGLVSPFELLIEDGDTFEPYITVLNSETLKEELAIAPAIMFGGGHFPHWVKEEAPEGVYHIGVAAEDFDGQWSRKYSACKLQPGNR